MSGQHSGSECEKTPVKDRLEGAIVEEIVRTNDDKQNISSWLNNNVRLDNTQAAVAIKASMILKWQNVSTKEVQSFCKEYGCNINQPLLFNAEGEEGRRKQRCFKIARKALTCRTLHFIDHATGARPDPPPLHKEGGDDEEEDKEEKGEGEEEEDEILKSHIKSTEEEIKKLCQDFKVEEMSFSPVEASTPTKPGRDQFEMTPTTKKTFREMTPGKRKAFYMGYAIKQSIEAKNDCSNISGSDTEPSDDSDPEEETRSAEDKQPSEDDCQELSLASEDIEYNAHVTGAIGVTQKVPKGSESVSDVCVLCKEKTPPGKKTQIIDWVECSLCLKWYHYRCAGVKTKPPGDWWCNDCTIGEMSNRHGPLTLR